MSFAPEGSTVTVAVSVVDGCATVTIEDEGPGIPEAHLDRVFERFFSYRPGQSRAEHVGLGLAIARQIVQGYGGTITRPESDGRWRLVRRDAAYVASRSAIELMASTIASVSAPILADASGGSDRSV